MKQQGSNSVEYRPALEPVPKWHEVLSYWDSKEVPQVEIVPYDPEEHDYQIFWFEKSLRFNIQRNSFRVVEENPASDTARALIYTVSKGGPSLFAAFALMTTLRHLGEPNTLVAVVRRHLDQISPDIRDHWHSNAKYLLPCMVDGGSRFIRYEDTQNELARRTRARRTRARPAWADRLRLTRLRLGSGNWRTRPASL
ncbi:MAG: hypothetical protein JZU65_06700 [Chlorobium sp.]|nr:hypothetical protein [Chlorobium sp.]